MAFAYGYPGYWRARAAEERAFAANSRSQAQRQERLALADRWETRARELEFSGKKPARRSNSNF
jgi:hypothetical protein